MAQFHDYRPCGSDVEEHNITAHFSSGEQIVILLSEALFIKITPVEARTLIGALEESIADFKEYAAGI
jgi:hypothetical protein